MDTNIKQEEGQPVAQETPTPPADMSATSQTPAADPQPQVVEATKSPEVLFAEESLGRTFESKEEAQKALKNLNSLVGDQTTAKQRRAIEKISRQANLTPEELYEILETQSAPEINQDTPGQPTIQPTQASDADKRLTRLEVDEVVKNDPDANLVRDTLFAESLTSGKPASEIWASKYKPLVEKGKQAGAAKLQQTKISQPLKAASTASEQDLKIDARSLTLEELEKIVPKGKGF
jgi:hypothetical protein